MSKKKSIKPIIEETANKVSKELGINEIDIEALTNSLIDFLKDNEKAKSIDKTQIELIVKAIILTDSNLPHHLNPDLLERIEKIHSGATKEIFDLTSKSLDAEIGDQQEIRKLQNKEIDYRYDTTDKILESSLTGYKLLLLVSIIVFALTLFFANDSIDKVVGYLGSGGFGLAAWKSYLKNIRVKGFYDEDDSKNQSPKKTKE